MLILRCSKRNNINEKDGKHTMAKITKEQVIKLNNQLSNGFQMDLMQLAMGEKVPTKKGSLDETKYLKASLYFYESYEKFVKTIRIRLNVSLYHVGKTADVSHGLGIWIDLESDLSKKLFKSIAKHTETLTEDAILEIHKNHSSGHSSIETTLKYLR